MKSTPSPEQAGKNLERALDNWARGYDVTTAFGNLLAMLVCEFTPHWIDKNTNQPRGRYTDQYLEAVKHFDPDHVRSYYPEVCQAIFAAFDAGVTADGAWCDPLGDYFQVIASQKDKAWKGQFFTPPSICQLMAKLVGQAKDEQPTSTSILDPACGSGRCLIAYDRSGSPDANNFYVGVDIDLRCIRIAAINLFFHGMRGVVICGNSLSMKMNLGYRIWHPLMGMGIEHLSQEQCMSYLLTSRSKDAPENSNPPQGKPIQSQDGQLLLFD